MKYTYEEQDTIVVRTDETGNPSFIPKDPANSDYQRYLCWLENPDAEEGGTL